MQHQHAPMSYVANYLKVVVEYVNRCLLKAQLKDVVGLLAGAFLLEYSHSSVVALAADKA